MQGLEHVGELVAFVQETGRYPSRTGEAASERTLAAWLQHRGEEARAGTLAPAYREGLAELPGWQTLPRSEADETRWAERLAALAGYRAAGYDWPRHKAPARGLEHDLGVWLHSQRSKLHQGDLDEAKVRGLDQAVPGWRIGRRRGRKPRVDGAAGVSNSPDHAATPTASKQ
ncbi:helicase associated domain-containing protein [uncultured Arthrobacter sp.]|uniref:helicase associated domain-containing protein n=1 Tax=uncultured Arthrobacter sp. TaxID=114050 RepID=UPI0028D5BBD8|nr:helicase associated domain-containing protein [uncultured Arthrobacter sp.]